MVADNESGKSIASEVRTSSGMFLKKAQVSESAYLSRIICIINLLEVLEFITISVQFRIF